LLALLGMTATQPLFAQSVDQLQQQQQKVEQQIQQSRQERDRLNNLQRSAEGTLQGLQQSLKTTSQQIQVSTAQLEAETRKLRQLEVALAQAEQAYRQKQFATVARLRFLQRQQSDRGWAVLLQSQNLTDFLDRRHQLKRVYQSDRQMLVNLKQEAERLEQERRQVEHQKNRIALLTQQLLAQKSDLEAQTAYQKETISRLRSDMKAMEAAETQLEQDSRNLAALIQRHMATAGRTAFRGTGRMVYPCAGEITSGFGWRTHPILGYQRFHAGVDFGADYGTVIYAADSGTVIFAGWYGGYGNAVIIDHGGGITTLYGHSSELYVAEGQTVQRGQAIAAVGSTGLSTGPHLHFEVRENGEPVDPMAYL
jgi:murein DD-endopeptidase MepM/ murein hydrolase activator NlpD